MKCIVIGGGAAGLMAGCMLARAGCRVELLERQPRVGKKLLATGNGRCNFTNMGASGADYHGSRAHIDAVLGACPPERVAAVFAEMGVPAYADAQGRAYPMSNMASSVLDALRLTFSEAGGAEITSFDAVSIVKKKDFVVSGADGRSVRGDKVIIAVGGLAAPKLGGTDGGGLVTKLGHRMTPRFPAITPVRTDISAIKGLKGLKVRGSAALMDGEKTIRVESGEALFTEYGLSGICVMQLSRMINGLKNPAIKLDMAPDMPESALFSRARALENRAMEDFLNGVVPRRVGMNILKYAGIADLSQRAGDLSRKNLSAVYRALRNFTLKVQGVCGFESAQVTAGGVDMSDFDPATLESGIVPGLYAAGEFCDVDGDCGGYNLNWAWASAICAAGAALENL
jgi:predicted Rossmann fold flavoprotein